MKLRIKIIISLILFFWCAGIFLPYYFHLYEPLFKLFPVLKLSYSHVCHQLDYKLLIINGNSTLVCARCTGIYLGLLVSSLVFLFFSFQIKITTKYFLLASIPMISDIIFYSLKIYTYSQFIAGSTGLLLGTIGFFYILEGIKILFLEINQENQV